MANNVNLRMQAYTTIKNKIINCEYRPGSMINEERLIAELKLTRTPIRDALGRLEQEGLLTIKPKKGILITPLHLEEVTYLLEARMLYELYAIREYGRFIHEADLLACYQELKATVGHPAKESSNPLDARLHSLIIDAVPNTYIRSHHMMVDDQIRRLRIRLRILTGVTQQRLVQSQQEHLSILSACLKKDWEQAEQALRIHLKHSNDSVIELFLSQLNQSNTEQQVKETQ
jgi:DNA-binding GntR family transcriptional regulator